MTWAADELATEALGDQRRKRRLVKLVEQLAMLPGPASATGRNLDVAVKGNAWMAVQATDGTEAYTCNGALDVNNEGLLVTRGGLTVMGDGGSITVPANAQLQIGSDGTLTATVGNGKPQGVGRLKLVTAEAPLVRWIKGTQPFGG